MDKFENSDNEETDYKRVRIDVVLLNKFLKTHDGDQDEFDCYCYMTPNSQALEKLEYFEEYKSSGDHGLKYAQKAIDSDLGRAQNRKSLYRL